MRSVPLLARSILFNALFYANLIVHMIVALPSLVLPYPILRGFLRSYGRSSLWLLRVVCGIKVEWRGLEKIPSGACIIACKHQSVWETFALYAVLRDPIYVVKRELMWIPVFGWYAWKARNIPVNRNAGLAALARMTVLARKHLEHPRQLVIFPEGTRRPPGAEPLYKPGVAYLYGKAGVACVPLALNSGLFWPRRSLRRFPGTILVEALEPIAPGLDRKAFFARLQSGLEDATARLIRESGIRDQGSGSKDECSKEIGY
ncbi:MAG TPA: lysophospholipid acyltransferase family protein [Xanthobacteraceae bacterium]|nr:lysophospholipid acyltransferase family protein [Xanthobacteraceae bacterium]